MCLPRRPWRAVTGRCERDGWPARVSWPAKLPRSASRGRQGPPNRMASGFPRSPVAAGVVHAVLEASIGAPGVWARKLPPPVAGPSSNLEPSNPWGGSGSLPGIHVEASGWPMYPGVPVRSCDGLTALAGFLGTPVRPRLYLPETTECI